MQAIQVEALGLYPSCSFSCMVYKFVAGIKTSIVHNKFLEVCNGTWKDV